MTNRSSGRRRSAARACARRHGDTSPTRRLDERAFGVDRVIVRRTAGSGAEEDDAAREKPATEESRHRTEGRDHGFSCAFETPSVATSRGCTIGLSPSERSSTSHRRKIEIKSAARAMLRPFVFRAFRSVQMQNATRVGDVELAVTGVIDDLPHEILAICPPRNMAWYSSPRCSPAADSRLEQTFQGSAARIQLASRSLP